MILLSSPLKNDPLETTVSISFFLEIEIFTTKIVNSKSLKKICRQLLPTMNVLKEQQTSDNLTVKGYCFITEIFDKFSFSGILRGCLIHLNEAQKASP